MSEPEKLYTKATIESTDKGLLAVASTAVEDRHGEIVSIEGWDLKNFKKNPVLLWGHDHFEPAIGVAKNIKVEGTGKKASLVFEPVFHEITEKARAIKRMFEEGILNSFSVGFQPKEMDGNTYTSQELLEISAVNVPANPDARMLAFKTLEKEGFSKDTMKAVGAFIEDSKEKLDILTTDDVKGEDEKEDDEVEQLKAKIVEMEEQLSDVVKGLQHLNPQGRKSEVVTTRLSLHKVIARANDKLLEKRPTQDTAKLLKVIKRANESLIVDQKQELKSHGKN